MSEISCPVCGNRASSDDAQNYFAKVIHCEICGIFFLESGLEGKSGISLKERSCLYYYLTQNNQFSEDQKIFPHFHNNSTWEDGIVEMNGHNIISIKSLLEIYPKNIDQKVTMSLVNISKLLKYVGKNFGIKTFGGDDRFYHVLFVDDSYGEESKPTQLYGLINILLEYGYLIKKGATGDTYYTLTAKGWKTVSDYVKSEDTLPQAFIAMWFDSSMHSVREKIKQAVTNCGYIPVLIDEKEHNEFIVPEILFEIKRSRFMISDYTGNRSGVYFESGYAKGLNKPVIMTCREGDDFFKVHFDTKQISHIIWTDENDLYNKLIKRIESTIGLRKPILKT